MLVRIANSADPDQTASEAVWLGYALFLLAFLEYNECSKFYFIYIFEHFNMSLLNQIGGYWDWNEQTACQNSKQGRLWSDCFFCSSLVFLLVLFEMQLVLEILEHRPHRML